MRRRWQAVVAIVAGLFLLLGGAQNSRAGIDDGLIASYTFSGGAADGSGHGHDGVVHDAIAVNDRFGNPGGAYSFSNGTWIEIPNSDELDLPQQKEMTISLWINPASTAGSQSTCASGTDNDIMETIFASTNGEEGSCFTSGMGSTANNYATVGFWFGLRNGKLQFYLRNNHKEWDDDRPEVHAASIDTIPAPAVGKWTHIVVEISTVYDVSSHVAGENMGRVWIYVDGVKQTIPSTDYSDVLGQPTEIVPFPRDYSHDQPLYVGARYYDRTPCVAPCVLDWHNGERGCGDFFAGEIDDLRIYNRILSAAEVEQLKNQSGDTPNPGGGGGNYTEGDYNYYLPYFHCTADHLTWTGYGISNSSHERAAPFAVTVYEGNGHIAKTVYPDPLPANGQAAAAIFTGQETIGWMRVNSHEKLTGLAFFGQTYMADIPFVDKLSSHLVIPHIAQKSDWDTILMVCNPNDKMVSLTLTCYGTSGAELAVRGFSLPAHNSEVYPFANFGINDLTGKVEIAVAPPSLGVAAFALYTNQKAPGGSFFAGINAVSLQPAAPSNPF